MRVRALRRSWDGTCSIAVRMQFAVCVHDCTADHSGVRGVRTSHSCCGGVPKVYVSGPPLPCSHALGSDGGIREGARKRQLEMPEIKAAFINGDNLKKKITDFRADRVGKVLIGESPIRLVEGIVQVLHVLPYSCLYSNASVDVFRALDWSRIPVMSQNLGLSSKINIDGVVAHRVINPQGSGAYTQLFRNGMIESVRVFPPRSDTGELVLPSTSYEREIIEFLKGIKKVLTELDISGPMIILYSLLNVKNVQLGVSNNYLLDEGTGIFDRDQILLPDIVIEDMAIDEGMALRPLFDLVWNAAGFRQSLNYDQHSGVWVNS